MMNKNVVIVLFNILSELLLNNLKSAMLKEIGVPYQQNPGGSHADGIQSKSSKASYQAIFRKDLFEQNGHIMPEILCLYTNLWQL